MIPLASLLFLNSNPRFQSNPAIAAVPSDGRSPEAQGQGQGQRQREHQLQHQLQRRRLPPALRLRRIADVPRHGEEALGLAHAAAPFWERQRLEQARKDSPRLAVAMRRRSRLVWVLLTLASFAAVDDYHLLPAGTVLYALAITMAWENWTDEVEEHRRLTETIEAHRRKMERIEKEFQMAKFEYHVLQKRPHVEIVALRRGRPPKDRGTNDDDRWVRLNHELHDQWIVYADDRWPNKRGR